MEKKVFCPKDYYCTVTVSFHQLALKRKPTMLSIFVAAVQLLLYCVASRSVDSGIGRTKIDFTCFRYTDPDPS